MLEQVVGVLACPLCGSSFAADPTGLRCVRGHSFDVARQGYASLLAGDAKLGTADTAAMVAARERFLSAGHFAPIAEKITAVVAQLLPKTEPAGPLVEVGAGTGYYLQHVLDALQDRAGIALDISKHAARRAAQAHPRMASIVADIWRGLPLQSSSVAVLLDVFAPRNPSEMARVLQPQGALIVVTPTSRHLHELVVAFDLVTVDEAKTSRLHAAMSDEFVPSAVSRLEYALSLSPRDVADVVGMGPSSRHIDERELQRLLGTLPAMTQASVSVDIATYRPRADDG